MMENHLVRVFLGFSMVFLGFYGIAGFLVFVLGVFPSNLSFVSSLTKQMPSSELLFLGISTLSAFVLKYSDVPKWLIQITIFACCSYQKKLAKG